MYITNSYSDDAKSNTVSLRYVFLVSLFSIPFGFEIGSLYTNLQVVNNVFYMDYDRAKTVLSAYFITMTVGLFLSGWISYSVGRKITILSSAAIGISAVLASIVAPDFRIFICTCLVLGISFGIYILSSLIYVSEITQKSNRGFSICLILCMLIVGCILAFLFNSVHKNIEHHFELFFFVFIFILLLIYCLAYLPESPRYLAISGFPDAALAVLFKLRHNMGVAAHELASINEVLHTDYRGLDFFIQNYNFRRCVFFFILISFLMSMSGILYLTQKSIEFCLVNSEYAKFFVSKNISVLYLVASFLGTLCTAFFIDRIGRAKMFLYSLLGIVCCFILSILMFIDENVIALYFAILVIYTFFSLVVISSFFVSFIEMMPSCGRDFGATIIFIININLFVFSSKVLDKIYDSLGIAFLISCSCILTLILMYLIYKFMPNIKKASLESIEHRLLLGKSFHDVNED